jgi:hypothetical protein
MLDVAVVEMPGGSRLIVLGNSGFDLSPSGNGNPGNSIGRWELKLPCPSRTRALFPATCADACCCAAIICSTFTCPGRSADRTRRAPLTLTCERDGRPVAPDAGRWQRARLLCGSRNFFTGALSPASGRSPTFLRSIRRPRFPARTYTLWAFAAVDGSLHLVDGMTDQAIRGAKKVGQRSGRGSTPTAARARSCWSRKAEMQSATACAPSRFPIAIQLPVSAAAEFDGRGAIVALWPESERQRATAIVRRKDTGWYEAYRVSVSCGN